MKTVYENVYSVNGKHLNQIQFDIHADGQIIGWMMEETTARCMSPEECAMWVNSLGGREELVARAGFYREDYLRIAKREREYKMMNDEDGPGAA